MYSIVRPLLAALVLGATLGGLGSVGAFFWDNREMSPCAEAGLIESDSDCLTAAANDRRRRNIVVSTAAGAGLGLVVAIAWIIPPALRMRRFMRDES
jgi:hypothetical protein